MSRQSEANRFRNTKRHTPNSMCTLTLLKRSAPARTRIALRFVIRQSLLACHGSVPKTIANGWPRSLTCHLTCLLKPNGNMPRAVAVNFLYGRLITGISIMAAIFQRRVKSSSFPPREGGTHIPSGCSRLIRWGCLMHRTMGKNGRMTGSMNAIIKIRPKKIPKALKPGKRKWPGGGQLTIPFCRTQCTAGLIL